MNISRSPGRVALAALAVLTLISAAGVVAAQTVPIANPELDGTTGAVPAGWTVLPGRALEDGYRVEVSTETPHDGAASVRLSWPGEQPAAERAFASLVQVLDGTALRGKRVRFRAAARNSRPNNAHVGLWMRVDRSSGAPGFFDNMNARPIRDDDWTFYEVTGDVAHDAARVSIGFLVTGAGEAWFDSASLEIVGDAAPEPEKATPDAADLAAAWLRANARPLNTTEIGAPRADLEAFSQMIGDARIVSLGEATHGTREHFQLKGRIIEHLVESGGFSAVGIEASYADTLAVNRYVLTGEGDLNTVVAGMGFWTWSTEEVAELVQWIRDHNAQAPEGEQVRFYGFDAQPTLSPLRAAAAYLTRAGQPLTGEDAALVEALTSDAGLLARRQAEASRDPQQLQRLDALGARLLDHFDREKERLIAATRPDDYAAHRQAAVAMRQAVEIAMAGSGGTRDRIMADNVDWILAQKGEDSRIVLWAHNGHVMHGERDGVRMMGGVLEQRHGDDHLTVGFMFGAGGFQAIGPSEGSPQPRLRPFIVGPEPGSIDAIFARVELPLYYVDLRPARDGAPDVWAWLGASHPTRWVGSMFNPDGASATLLRPLRFGREFDIAIMTLATTPARPLRRPDQSRR
jgi:erythromycin esterase-like protein